ncbi:MAG: hypothetical protein RM347_025515 [Nostoc sp. ChiQUE02]|uniref:hypothetical protein n=1 Tax=Nostoc sp. ChiQUE02 TaxID=3075377 RepID=UPI002AD58632|nr:hypothetical protein [Nostoc sp. ChiQUE02]MDZ8234128.1 hypothetical protein [Nostoc sp. ChiQUE02]
MKVNEWINHKFWQSIFIGLVPFVAHLDRIQVQYQRCLRQATPNHTAKLNPKRICGKALNLHYISILYNLDIAIALKAVLKQNWVTQKISLIHSWINTKLIVPITKQENWFAWEHNQVDQFSVLYSDNIERCPEKITILEIA